jgi:RNA polymerase sigma-70 factor (ECF subfamily)
MDDDARLMQLVSRGDREAFRVILERYEKAVFNFFLRLTGSVEDSEDLAQELFIRIYRSAPRYRPAASFRTFLYTIASNLAMSHLRKRKLRRSVSIEEMIESGIDVVSQRYADSPAATLAGREMERRYVKALSRLPEEWRVAIELRVGMELSYEEIAAAMGKSVSAVESILYRARERIAGEMEG